MHLLGMKIDNIKIELELEIPVLEIWDSGSNSGSHGTVVVDQWKSQDQAILSWVHFILKAFKFTCIFTQDSCLHIILCRYFISVIYLKMFNLSHYTSRFSCFSKKLWNTVSSTWNYFYDLFINRLSMNTTVPQQCTFFYSQVFLYERFPEELLPLNILCPSWSHIMNTTNWSNC